MTAAVYLAGLGLAWAACGLASVVYATRRPSAGPRSRAALPAVSVLKPLCGADAGLADNLRSFFVQEGCEYELVFGVESERDPAVACVRALMAEFPAVPARLAVHHGGRAQNPKVRNLLGMLPHARHDLILISDSNVRAPADYVAEAVATRQATGAGVVTHVFTGSGERNLGAALENVQLNGFCAAGACLPTLFGDAAVIGKSMLMSRTELESLGGLERVAHVLAEDFVLGKMYQHGGHRVAVARTVLHNVTRGTTLRAFFARHRRWATLRYRLRPIAFALEPLTSPLVLTALTAHQLGLRALVLALAVYLVRDVGGWVALRGLDRAWLPLMLAPLRDVFALGAWAVAPLSLHVKWRGHRVRLGAGTLLFQPGAPKET